MQEEGIMLAEGRIVVFYRFGALTIVALNQGTPRPVVETVESKVELKVVILGRICVYYRLVFVESI